DLHLLLRYCDQELSANHARPALAVWGALAAHGLVPLAEVNAVANGDFSAVPLERGFDWRPAHVEGVTLSFDPSAREMLLTLSGRQPAYLPLIEQYVVVEPGETYELRFRQRSHELGEPSGLAWIALDGRTRAELPSSTPVDGKLCFTVPQ